MRPIDQSTTRRLDLESALVAEANAPNDILPPQPGLRELAANPNARFISWLASELQNGLAVSPQVVVNGRKPRHGTRPVPIIPIPERIAYRAVCDLILDGQFSTSHIDYTRFVQAPVLHIAEQVGPNPSVLSLLGRGIQYVVKTDVASFYQYIDHGILARMLVSRSPHTELIPSLVELLADLEGRSYGLPQMFSASDRLAEVYAQMLEDQMLRRGFLLWRFNDDFRIAVKSFLDALDSIEALSEEARSLGLILNEHKTVTPKFENYVLATYGLIDPSDVIPTEEQDRSIDETGYDDRHYDPDEAWSLLQQVTEGERSLQTLDSDDVVNLRHAILNMAEELDDRGFDFLTPLMSYVPSLTPTVCKYLYTLAEVLRPEVSDAIDTIVEEVPLGGWQRLWLCHVIRLAGQDLEASIFYSTEQAGFLEECSASTHHTAAKAEAILALAEEGLVEIGSIAHHLITEPRAVCSWYVFAAIHSVRSPQDEKVLQGIRGTDPLYGFLIDSRT